MPASMWDQMLAVNLRSVFLCTHFVLHHLASLRLFEGFFKVDYITSAFSIHRDDALRKH
jgi:NAD(P)-dependent dehydrogenase (short-subunit alcohol dehydrogenase family)